jgi:ABC-type bacteriocin/lantibiotic exporter with double-glycine peptidase domain
MEAVECGAAALAMVLAHHGAWIPLEQLRIACGVSRDGSKASNIVRAARTYGLEAKGFRREPTTLHELPMPCIIHWNFNHFVVLEGIDGNDVYINDPAVGRRRTDMVELDLAFTGVALAMEPTAAFQRSGSKPQGLRLLLRELRSSKTAVALLLVVSLVLVVPAIVAAGFSKIFIDDILIQQTSSWFIPLLIGMALTAMFRAVLTLVRQSLLLRLQTKLSVVMVSRFLWHVMALPVEFFTQRHAGDIATRVGASEQIGRLLSSGVAANALNLTSIVFLAAAMAIYDLPAQAMANQEERARPAGHVVCAMVVTRGFSTTADTPFRSRQAMSMSSPSGLSKAVRRLPGIICSGSRAVRSFSTCRQASTVRACKFT